ncbi:hypothetical protein SAMN05444358_1011853 [Ruegeria halocynthiae]|uniref:Uncharacterized protein n=1 Tax=Ruegeria halocynthiae TaxID=985054 RepID=A0A1H2WNQ0_9RHOB|nr:hypothetical protein [Ruegeria halocynthiae]SDW82165.1 hypothetical protein SAMN05444358_1011853 [Ruegeria halocynthiae]
MSRWSNEFENHPLHETLRQSAEFIEVEVENTELEFDEERHRLTKVLGNLQDTVTGLDDEFFPKALLDQINQHLRHGNFFQQLQAYMSSPQITHLQTANNHITQYAPQIYQLAAMSRLPEPQKVIKHAEKAYRSFSASMDGFIKQTEEKLEETAETHSELENKANDLGDQLDSLSTNAETKFSEWQSDFTEKQTARAEEHSEAQIERDTKFEELLSEWRKSADTQHIELGKSQAEKLTTLLERFTKQGETALADVNAKHQAVLEIHKLVGRDSVAGGYQKSAGEEKKEADLWRWISMGSLGAAIVWLAFKYWVGFEPTDSGTLNWANIITASSLTAILLVTAGYASRQSKMHRDNEKQMRSFALETKALDPFIANLEEKDQKEIKAELIKRMFGQQHIQISGRLNRIDDGTVKTLAERIADKASQALIRSSDKS